MEKIALVAQTVSIFSACWAIIAGIGAWKREFIGKRKIELAEQVLAKFFEVKDAFLFIRNPFSSVSEGSSRQRAECESPEDSRILDRGYIVVERYKERESVFSEFSSLKYRFMAAFGKDTESIFTDTFREVNSIFVSAGQLSRVYWRQRSQSGLSAEQIEDHIKRMRRHEAIFWDTMDDTDDVIRLKLQSVQDRLEKAVMPAFEEPSSLYALSTARLFRFKR